MDARSAALKEKLDRLLREAAETAVELDWAEGTIRGVPHYSIIELRAHELGRQFSRSVQERQMAEVVAHQAVQGKCPTCGTACELQFHRREDVASIDGKISLQEVKGHCPCCRKDFFPSAGDAGI